MTDFAARSLGACWRAVFAILLAAAVFMSISAHLNAAKAASHAPHGDMVAVVLAIADIDPASSGAKAGGDAVECCGGCVAGPRAGDATSAPGVAAPFPPRANETRAKTFASRPTPPPRAD